MMFRYAGLVPAREHELEGYERLILLTRCSATSRCSPASDGIERLWEISAPLLENPPPVEPYAPGSWGPQPDQDRLIAPYHWYLPDNH